MGNNYIVTISNDDLCPSATLTWKDFQAAKYAFDMPFQLELADGHVFYAERVVRLIPKRRLVVFGTWKDRPVVAKLFFHSKHGKRHLEKDLKGIKTLQDHKIPTPALLHYGTCEDNHVYVLILERIFNSKNLEEIWQEKESIQELMPLLKSVIVEIATQHVLGVLQHDMHLKNYLLVEKSNLSLDSAEIGLLQQHYPQYKQDLQAEQHIYTLDGAEIELHPHLLSKKMSMKNLALFLSQLGVVAEPYYLTLFNHYAKSRGWLVKKEDKLELFLLIKKWNDKRWERFEKKVFRESTSFACVENIFTFSMMDRQRGQTEFLEFMKNPDASFRVANDNLLKKGRSSTVLKTSLDGKDVVIKRYNMKNMLHFLRRCLRGTRAAHSWRLAQKLHLFGVRTALPLAFIEKKYLFLRHKSYYVSEFISNEHVGNYFVRHANQPEKISTMIIKVTALLKNLAKLDISHGDLKATNILIDAHEQPVLIDLDGAQEHASISSLRSAWRKDIKRFLHNFRDQAAVYEQFKMEFEKA